MWRVPPLQLREGDREELERRLRAHSSAQRQVRRARIVLLAAEGVPNRKIAKAIGIDEDYVGVWRKRYEAEGLKGLEDRARSGRPPTYGPAERLALSAKATEERPEVDSHWSHRTLAEAMAMDGIQISPSQAGRILGALEIKPHRVRQWLNRRDSPEFWERAADVCGLYLSPPQNAFVVSVDEKTAIPARSRKHPTKPAAPGQPERREFEYVRHGTACLMTALDVASGEVLAAEAPRNDSASFCTFLGEIDAAVPSHLDIHMVLDNGSSHVAKSTKAWLAEHPRFHPHYTPKHASWLNQVELFLSIITRRLLKRGEFHSREDMVAKVMAFIAEYDRTAKPFVWKYDAKPRLAV